MLNPGEMTTSGAEVRMRGPRSSYGPGVPVLRAARASHRGCPRPGRCAGCSRHGQCSGRQRQNRAGYTRHGTGEGRAPVLSKAAIANPAHLDPLGPPWSTGYAYPRNRTEADTLPSEEGQGTRQPGFMAPHWGREGWASNGKPERCGAS